MSDDLYSTRLRWTGGRGIAKLHGKIVALKSTPQLTTCTVDSIDYVPEIGLGQVMPRFEGWRDMWPAECRECDALLVQLHFGGES